MSEGGSMNFLEATSVMIDAVLEAGGTKAEHGPGIVKRVDPRDGYPRERFPNGLMTLPSHSHHLHVRGTFAEDYNAALSLGILTLSLSPFEFESAGDL